jgi:hypothetical protein
MDRDLYDDLKADPELMTKLQEDRYAQNVYAALCNMRWQPQEVWPVLQDEYWSCSWRSAGGLVADLRNRGEDYMDWYCSGITGGYDSALDTDKHTKGYVPEGEVTDEIREDFARLGWHPSPWPKDKD